ncbi:ABC transporter ATP-binding protein [Paenibacillus sp. VCA1]|uniref:ABC transporter ATP-binding protein n=1 Tax=Paenibacillus sp. VCA1 TaxID=3039148 RepID=UPI002871D0CD|nr:ABC transporter ATP-binding protein [Paenibacillus sp. VCA1]MDR9857808.1 ABC transporter ATP-binding protein [Paenibacillus sp. VCA1]
MINYRRYRRQIERMYEDSATISRYVYVKDPITKETKQELLAVYVDQPCKLSQTGLARNGQTEDANNLQYDAKLFIAPELEIHQGDVVAVTRAATGRVETYTAGQPFPPYSSHQEINLTRKDWA